MTEYYEDNINVKKILIIFSFEHMTEYSPNLIP